MKIASDQLTALITSAYPRLKSIPEARSSLKPSAAQWSAKEMLGHLIDSASNNHQRIVRMQELPDIGTFRYSQEHWVRVQQYQAEPWAELVEFWYRYNVHLARIISAVRPELLGNVCDIGKTEPGTLKYIIEDYLRHVKHHLARIFDEPE